ncbi:hypothetical protein V497_02286 [Pseudogymnoascus sp. VKM F-4516 (FW-969)]|nr:hypothetical protein V497_02286 [Pseudogymnoascus sp. VKM F-4516 (FW-969)]
MTTTTEISIIGLGNMGTALAHTFLKANKTLTIWNRTPTAPSITALISAGATFVPSLPTALSASPLIILCILDYPAIDSLFATLPPGILKDKIIINLTNGTPRQARHLATWMQDNGVANYLDGGIMATPDMIGTPASSLFISGADEPAFASVKEEIAILGAPRYMGTDPGAAALYDLALLAGMYGMFAGSLTAMALMRRLGGEETLEARVEGLLNPWMAALIPYQAAMAGSVDRGSFEALGNPVGMQREALKNILRACEEEGVDGGCLGYFEGLVGRVVEDKGGDGGLAGVEGLLGSKE